MTKTIDLSFIASLGLIFHEDPGHGWLQVPRERLQELGIAGQITAFSYQKGEHAYLEEDMDLSTYLRAEGIEAGSEANRLFWDMVPQEYREDTPIRNYRNYHVPPRVKLELGDASRIRSFTMFAKAQQLVDAIMAGKTPMVDVRLEGKTRVEVSIYGGGGAWRISQELEGFKTFTKEEMNYFHGGVSKRTYFVLSKKHGYGTLLKYIQALLEHWLQHVPLAEIPVHLEDNRALQDIRARFPEGAENLFS